MVKFIHIVVFLVLVTVCCAEPVRLRKQSRLSVRQEIAEEDIPTQTPYPPAGLVPEVPFDLPTKEKAAVEPENTYLPPDNVEGVPAKTYGPPEAGSGDDDIADVTENATEIDQTDEPESTEQSQEQESAEQEDDTETNEIERLRVRPLKSQRLVAQPILKSQPLITQPLYFTDAHGRLFTYNPQFLRV